MRQRELVRIPGAILILAVAVLGFAVVVGGGVGACAAPPPSWHRVPALNDFWGLLPALVVLFVGEYIALGAERRSVRITASALVLITAGVVLLFAPFSCGQFAP